MYKIAGGIVVLLLSFWATLLLLDSSSDKPVDPDACPPGEKTVLTGPYPLAGNHAYKAAVPSLAHLGDTDKQLYVSPTRLCEDNMVLGPPHSVHAEIFNLGLGRYSHFGAGIFFSTSDNSDPNSNGRKYTIVVPARGR